MMNDAKYWRLDGKLITIRCIILLQLKELLNKLNGLLIMVVMKCECEVENSELLTVL